MMWKKSFVLIVCMLQFATSSFVEKVPQTNNFHSQLSAFKTDPKTTCINIYNSLEKDGVSCGLLKKGIETCSTFKYLYDLMDFYSSLNCESIRQRSLIRQAPALWNCSAEYYNASDGCDCGCGAYDPDCSLNEDYIIGCDDGIGSSCNSLGECVYNFTTPIGWTCSPLFYNASDGCDCSCGIQDPDCIRSSYGAPDLTIFGCNRTLSADSYIQCVDGNCIENIIPDEWVCDYSFYNANDGCDCNCGVVDPDCVRDNDQAEVVFNCPCKTMECSIGYCVGTCNGHTISLDVIMTRSSESSAASLQKNFLRLIFHLLK